MRPARVASCTEETASSLPAAAPPRLDVFWAGEAFLALDQDRGAGQCWGVVSSGGLCLWIDFAGVTQVFANVWAFLAQNTAEGTGQCWGDSSYG